MKSVTLFRVVLRVHTVLQTDAPKLLQDCSICAPEECEIRVRMKAGRTRPNSTDLEPSWAEEQDHIGPMLVKLSPVLAELGQIRASQSSN